MRPSSLDFFTPEKINMAAAHVFLDALFTQCFCSCARHAMNDKALRVRDCFVASH